MEYCTAIKKNYLYMQQHGYCLILVNAYTGIPHYRIQIHREYTLYKITYTKFETQQRNL